MKLINKIKISLSLFFILNMISNVVFSQKTKKETLFENKEFTKVLDEYKFERIKDFDYFSTYGYIELKLSKFNLEALKDEIKYIFYINDQYVPIKPSSSNLPFYYFELNNKPVLIYFDLSNITDNCLSKRNLKKLIRLVENSLEKTQNIEVKDPNGKTIIKDPNFRPNDTYNIHNKRKIIVYGDGKIKLV